MGSFEGYKPPISENTDLIKKEVKPKKKKFLVNPGFPKRPRLKVGFSDEFGKIKFEAKDPAAMLLKAEELFKNGDFENAWLKISMVSEEDREKRQKELMQGNDEDGKLAEEMYNNEAWIKDAENDWRNSSALDRKKEDAEK